MHPSESQAILWSQEDAVLHLRLNRPDKRNALTMPMFEALSTAIEAAENDDGVKALLVSGSGVAFCAGHDLEAFAAWPQLRPTDPVPRFLKLIASATKPMVLAVHGAAAGIGVTWMLHADHVVAAPEAKFRLPFVELGISPEAGSTLLLPAVVGLGRARKLLMSATDFSGSEAHAWGLVSELVEASSVQEAAVRAARALAGRDVPVMRRLKAWLSLDDAQVQSRIDEEVAEINAAILRRRAMGAAP